ncbi:hypothetical protein EDE08_101628 [Bradyrhizobium sp. R2.2-H]|jgi:hypothetical protein|uniref:hypothetical protein n=1 Tax=unclassified Bradyrhizobium TaxID=2631580 RepID=UPI00104CB3B9|nr:MULTISPECIES: hypothetical protein [unclassified Bradyrhizobium]TCU78846.1 hypothetical protein EDE10_101629 [Bradyrhizobium sp. Y-H1]TCU80929.1 hypothetical protein EDE08_101628 [Bradyrhizobium sp. R2.2-H]
MENKTTTELLDLLWKIESQKEPDWDKYEEVRAELEKRPPFKFIGINDNSDESHDTRIDELESDVKLLKRHKHDPHSGDVMTRI